MSRKHLPLYVGGGVTLVLAGVLGFFLFQQTGAYEETKDSLNGAQRKLVRLTNREPAFPSEANVELEQKQIEVYSKYKDDLFAAMRKGQVELWESDRDGFRRRLQECLGNLMRDASTHSVQLPPRFPFGFQRYIAGALPEDEEISRLMAQLQAVTAICGILYDAGIAELREVERTEFEKNAQASGSDENASGRLRRRGRDRGEEETSKAPTELYVDPDHLFCKEHFAVTFTARDDALWRILDRLARGAPFIVVTGVTVTNPERPVVAAVQVSGEESSGAVSQDVWTSAGGRNTLSGTQAEELPRELRISAGQEKPEVRMELDVYRFLEKIDETEAEGEE